MTTTPINVGMLSFAHEGHAASYAACLATMPDVALVAIADDNIGRGQRYATQYGATFYANDADLLARDDIAAVVICSENARHAAQVQAAAAAGKHILCEKPLATTQADGEAMVAACKQHGVQLQIAFPMRFSPPTIAFREAIRSGAVGTPLMVKATNPGRMPPGWFSDPVLAGGGATMDHTVHVADLLRWIFDTEISSVYAEIDARIHPGMPTDDLGLLMLDLANGITASLDASWSRAKTWPIWGGLTMEVIGDNGALALDAFNQNVQYFNDQAEKYTLVPYTGGGDPGLVRAFIDAVRNGTPVAVSGEDGLRALDVALSAYESARTHSIVRCPNR